MHAGAAFQLLKDAYKGWSEDQASRLAAALAFYTIFAIAPLLIVVTEIAAMLLGGAGHNQVVRDQILNELRPAIGDTGTKAIADIVQATFQRREQGRLASIVGWALFAVAASGLIVAIQGALDTIWGIKPSGGIVRTILDRCKSFTVIGTSALVVIAMLFATALVSTFVNGMAARIANAALLLVAVTVITAAVYKWLPKVRLSWRDVWVGAIVSSVLSVIGQYLIGLYLGRAATTSAYGAAGSLVAVLLWLYYSAQLFLFGAEITKAYANRFGSQARPAPAAQRGTIDSTRRPLSV
jgi:membrane protein